MLCDIGREEEEGGEADLCPLFTIYSVICLQLIHNRGVTYHCNPACDDNRMATEK